MPRNQDRIFIGIYNAVLCIDPKDGSELWRSKVKNAGFVNVMWDGDMLLASSGGELFRIDPRDGTLMWQNKLKGLGMGVVTMASTRQPLSGTNVTPSEQARRNAASSAAAGA